ncbi:GrpB family protein [Clostridioides sp. ES-S-0108-01]|uniref:GrpB family protein n=1 Tax=Clostridioides sp. ES-S-0108-01 TaxID=2770773 RepID=UPI001D0C5F37
MVSDIMLGLKRGIVGLVPHQTIWHKKTEDIIILLKKLLGEVALDIQHIGSTSICKIHAKPIIDIAIGVSTLDDILY